jgi:hypothetical protein
MDLFLFNDKDFKWFEERGRELVKVDMEPGDFVFCDSRTMHYARLPEGDQIRHVQNICMTPCQLRMRRNWRRRSAASRITWAQPTGRTGEAPPSPPSSLWRLFLLDVLLTSYSARLATFIPPLKIP